MMLFGAGLNGGTYGSQSNLVDLDGNDPMFTTDYRSVYSTLLQDWIGLPGETVDTVLGGSFPHLEFVGDRTTVSRDRTELPRDVTLGQNYPNPFNPTTSISFHLAQGGPVRLAVYDVHGRRVATLVEKRLEAGSHSLRFNAANLPSGTYLYRLDAGSRIITKKMTLAK